MAAALRPSCATRRREGFFVGCGGMVQIVVGRGSPGRSGAPPWERVLSGDPCPRARDNGDASRRGADPGPGDRSPGTVARTQFGGQATGSLTTSLSMTDVTRILLDIEQGNPQAAE